eukprot:99167-Amphidinium_carterae.1
MTSVPNILQEEAKHSKQDLILAAECLNPTLLMPRRGVGAVSSVRTKRPQAHTTTSSTAEQS